MFPKIKKGSILRILHNKILAIDQSDPQQLSDYQLESNFLSKLNVTSNCRFYMNVQLDTKYWFQTQHIFVSIDQNFNDTLKAFNFSLAFSDDGIILNKKFEISQCKIKIKFI